MTNDSEENSKSGGSKAGSEAEIFDSKVGGSEACVFDSDFKEFEEFLLN